MIHLSSEPLLQTYEADSFSPLVLCDFCPRAYHMACLAPPPAPPTEKKPAAESSELLQVTEATANESSAPTNIPKEEEAVVGEVPLQPSTAVQKEEPTAPDVKSEEFSVALAEKKEELGEVAAAPTGEGGEGPEALVAPVFGFANLCTNGHQWACPKCEERHKRSLQG